MSSLQNKYIALDPELIATPNWAKCERLDYCESYKTPAGKGRVARLLSSLGFIR